MRKLVLTLVLCMSGCVCRPTRPPERVLDCEGVIIDTTCLARPDGVACCLGPGMVGVCDGKECIQ